MGHIWRFGDCELDEAGRVLRVRGTPVEIETKPFEVLRTLLLHAGEVVTKAELLDSVWPGTAVVDGSLATAVSKVRKLIGDDDRVIVTVPRVGYKLAAPVHCTARPLPSEPPLDLRPGQPVPRREQWRLIRRLDLSPSSEVWLAHHHKTRDARVFKFASDDVRLRALKREVTVARLLREAQAGRQEFVRVLEWSFDTAPYLVESEYAGPNLSEWAEAQGGLRNVPWDLRLKLLTDVVHAVAAAHALDVLHKDLKPANILVTLTPDGTAQIRIADFGSAALLVPARLSALGITNLGFTQTSGTDASALTGTLMYIAPEVYAGQTPTAASDVYALGVLLYQFAAGNFRKPLAPGWEADVEDPLIREDIADAACGDPTRRLPAAGALAERLATLDRRRAEREAFARQRQEETAAELRRKRMRARRPWLALAGVILLAVIVYSMGVFRETSDVRTVAVLPLQNTQANADNEFLRRALADEIATALSHSHGLQVRPFSSSEKYDADTVDAKAAGRELQVDTVVTGRYLEQGDRLHITLEAIDIEKDRVIWTDSFDAPVKSLIAAQVQIALRVHGALAGALGSSSVDVAVEPKNEEAYELYLRSLALPGVPANNRQALEMLERAVSLDPGYPPAWLALGRRYYVEARYGGGDASMMKRYDAALERALSLDPNYVAAAAGLMVSRVERGELVAAYRSAVDLVARRPDSADAQFVLSYVFRYAGLLNEAAGRCDTALVLDRKMQTNGLRSCAMVFILRGDYSRAVNYLQFDQGSDFARALTIDMLARQGRTQEALQVGAPNIAGWKSYDVLRACLAGKPSSEVTALAESVRASEDPELNYFAAGHFAYCGQTAAAVELLKRAIDRDYCSYPAMERDPLFARIRATSDYAVVQAAGRACQERFLATRGE